MDKNKKAKIVSVCFVLFPVCAVLMVIGNMMHVYELSSICMVIMAADLIAFFILNSKAKKAQKENDEKEKTKW